VAIEVRHLKPQPDGRPENDRSGQQREQHEVAVSVQSPDRVVIEGEYRGGESVVPRAPRCRGWEPERMAAFVAPSLLADELIGVFKTVSAVRAVELVHSHFSTADLLP
jgi:hypothetical protein